ncbi:ty3-gypsy retrotransposon protein [Cucumis melo var. makuwa]|uniref:Ty3-gypsy retrotransposon protein n=1 Tax=Cucumis melo var. makuwa TaxID=1194695 RepID=A0A5D3BQC7_CUCMM|nr:ty3-gypsy retrotransposon protein [Cucumis melo var. makuwa]
MASKAASKSYVASDAYTEHITRSRSKGITPEQDQSSDIAQSILKQLMESLKAGIILKKIFYEAAMAEMERKINFLMKVMEERDHEITTLREQLPTHETAESSQTSIVKATDKGKNVVQENQPQQKSVSVASLSVQQLQDMIANSIKAQYGGPPQTSFMYSKPYTKRINDLRMWLGEDQLVRQFVRSLKLNAFEWYTDLELEVIDSLEQLQNEFLNSFYSIRHTGLLFILQEIKLCIFEELATRAHDMELSITSKGTKDFPVPEVRKDKKETKGAETTTEEVADPAVEIFVCDHQDENLEVVVCHAINATEKEKIPPRSVEKEGVLKDLSSSEVVLAEIPLVNREDNLQLKSRASRKPHKSTGTFNSGKGEASMSTTKSESPFVESPQGLKVGDIEVLKESFTTLLTKITKQEIKIDLTEASLPQRQTKDGFDPKAYKLMVKVGYDFTTHTEFKSLKIHEQPKLSSIQKKLLREGHAILVSKKGLGYKSPEPIRITKKRKEKVVDNNNKTVEEVDSMEE